jgi:Domain of unknown function (DUF222)
MMAALAAGEMSESYARTLCGWTGKLPEDCRDTADEILAAAAGQGMDLRDLATLAAEIQSRAGPGPGPGPGDEDPGQAFEDRAVRLETTFGGAGVFSGDLTPECTALAGTVLDALSAPQGADDTRSHAQRYHDALEEATASAVFLHHDGRMDDMQADQAEAQLRAGVYARLSETYDAAESVPTQLERGIGHATRLGRDGHLQG